MGKEQDAATGARIRERRLAKGLTQGQLGGEELSAGYISMIEGGHRRLPDDYLEVIASRLDMDPSELITGVPAGLEAQLEMQLHLARRRADEGALDEAEAAVENARATARQHGLNRVEARAEESLGSLAERSGDPVKALEHFERAEELWKDEPIHLRAVAVTGLANCTRVLGDPQMALHSLDQYQRDLIATKQPHPVALMRTYTEMVYAYFAVGLPEKAGDAARQALRLEAQVEDPDELACMHLTVAQSLHHEGRYGDALDSIRRAHELYTSGGWGNKAAKALIAEAFVLCDKEDYSTARERLLETLDLLGASPNRVDEAMALNQLGHVMRNLEDPQAGLAFLEEALPLLHETDVIERAFNARETGLCHVESDPAAAEVYLKQAIELYRARHATDDLAATYKDLGDLYVSQGRRDLALTTFRNGLEGLRQRRTA